MGLLLDNPPLLVGAAFFLAIFLFCLGVTQALRQRALRRQLVGKIRGGGVYVEPEAVEEEKEEKPSRLLGLFGRIGRRAAPEPSLEEYSASRLKFLRAGIRYENALAVHWGIKILLTVFFPAAFLLLRALAFGATSYPVTLTLAVGLALLGFYLPDLYLRQKADSRREKILRALPDALDLLVICVEAGMGLDAAIAKVSQELKLGAPELADELHFMNLELRAGKKRTDALRHLAERTHLDEIRSLATLLIQTDKFGTSMADALRVYSDSYRTRRYQKAEELAAKLPVKMVLPLLFCIFPSLFLVILGPAAINIYRVLIKGAFAR
ncbi:MAG: type II secretion system F family protein [Desulfobacterales bacterium]